MRGSARCAGVVLVTVTASAICSAAVTVRRTKTTVRVEVDGELFTEYHYDAADRPFFYPVICPTGVNITRNWPMKNGKDEQTDHKHHRGLWYTHGAMNGHDFWTEGKGARIVQKSVRDIASGRQTASFTTRSEWVAKSGKVVCTDTRKHTFHVLENHRFVDFEITIHASHGPLVMGDTKEGSMAIRVAPTLRLEGKVAKGSIVNSEGVKGKKAWGKRAKWCDYYGPLNGQTVGVAIFDHPTNPHHPTWWMARHYGLFTANGHGVHYFEKKPKGTGDLEIAAGKSVTYKYRFYFHKGDCKAARVSAFYDEYAKPQ